MSMMTISLPDAAKQFVETQPSDYILQLIRKDQKQLAEQRLISLLEERLNSGEPIEVNAEFWEKKRKLLIAQGQNSNG